MPLNLFKNRINIREIEPEQLIINPLRGFGNNYLTGEEPLLKSAERLRIGTQEQLGRPFAAGVTRIGKELSTAAQAGLALADPGTYVESGLVKAGVDPRLALGIGFAASVAFPGPGGEAEKAKRLAEIGKVAKNTVSSISRAKASGQSFDEWVKGQGKPVFRGVFPNVEKFETSVAGKFREYGFSVSESKDIAQKYAFELDVNQPMKLAKEGNVLEGILTSNAKIKEIGKIGVNEAKAELKVAKTQNFDGVRFIAKETGETEIVVLNPDILKTRSQLKAEWEGVKDLPKPTPTFQGLKNLSTKLLEKFKGMAEEITPQQFNEVINRTTKEGIRKADLDMIKEAMERQVGKKIETSSFGDTVKIPQRIKDYEQQIEGLKYQKKTTSPKNSDVKAEIQDEIDQLQDYTNKAGKFYQEQQSIGKINLTNLAKDVETQLVPLKQTFDKTVRHVDYAPTRPFIDDPMNYQEVVYQSPIKTSAGNIHYTEEEFPNYFSHVRFEDLADGKTRKILETQSDLMQKENFANEMPSYHYSEDYLPTNLKNELFKVKSRAGDIRRASNKSEYLDELKQLEAREESLLVEAEVHKQKRITTRGSELSKLQPYSSNDPLAQLRTFREEVKRAAKDGKDTILIPSGETAMKIEGLGESSYWANPGNYNHRIKPEEIGVKYKVGSEINQGGEDFNSWIITDVLGDGKFKAVPKSSVESKYGTSPQEMLKLNPHLENLKETFDISGKVDTKHFVYKLNEEAIPREARKMGLEVEKFIDEKGAAWWKIKLPKERASMPVEAFSIGALPFLFPQLQITEIEPERLEIKAR